MRAKAFVKIIAAMLALTMVIGLTACEQTGDYKITVDEGNYGTVTTLGKADAGELVTVDVDANYGYEVYRLYVNGTPIEGNTFIMPASNVTLSVAYATESQGAYTVTVEDNIYGATYANLATANAGDLVTLTTATSYASKLKNYVVNGEKITGNTFTMPAQNVVVTAEYDSLIPYTPVSFEVVASYQRARSYWYASYEPEGVRIRAVVDDPITFAANRVDSNMGYKDNVEFTVGYGVANDLSPKHFNVLVSCDGDHWFRQYNGGWVAASETGVIIEHEVCNVFDHGFNGYIATVTIPYIKFGITMGAAVNNMTLGVSMRNTTNRLKTAWGSFTEMGHVWGNGRKHLVITEDGLVPNVSPADYLMVGDQLLYGISGEYGLFGSSATEIEVEKTLAEWAKDVDRIAMYNPKEITFSCGTNDLMQSTVISTFSSLKTFVENVRIKLPATKILVVSAIPTIASTFDVNKVLAYNAMVKDYAETLPNVSYLDLCSEIVKDGVINLSMYNSADGLFDTGYALLRKLFHTHYGRYVAVNYGTEWGDVGNYLTIGQWNVSSSMITANNGGTSFIYLKTLNGAEDFDFTVKMGADVVHNADAYPKFGIHLNNSNLSRYYFVYADGLTKNIAGDVDRNHKDYDWSHASEINVADLVYSGGSNYATLKISKRGSTVTYTCNDVVICSGTDALGTEPVTLGLFAFNLSIRVTEWSLVSYGMPQAIQGV